MTARVVFLLECGHTHARTHARTHACSFPFDDHHPHLIRPSLDRPTLLTIPNGIRIHSAVLPQYTFQSDRPTHTQSQTQLITLPTARDSDADKVTISRRAEFHPPHKLRGNAVPYFLKGALPPTSPRREGNADCCTEIKFQNYQNRCFQSRSLRLEMH